MGRKCCVPNCCSNYDATIKRGVPAISTFKFPEVTSVLDRWIEAIRRPGWIPTKRSSVCIKHFAPDDIERQDKPAKLKPGAVPSIFGEPLLPVVENKININRKHSKIDPQLTRRRRVGVQVEENDFTGKATPEVVSDCIKCFDDFRERAENELQNTSWMVLCRADVVHLFLVDDSDDRQAIRIDRSIKVCKNLRVRLFIGETEETATQWDRDLVELNQLLRWSQLKRLVNRFGAVPYSQKECDEISLPSRDHSEEHSKDGSYDTIFLEEHLEEAENENSLFDAKEATIETTVELRIEKQASEEQDPEHPKHSDHLYNITESSEQLDECSLKQTACSRGVKQFRSFGNNCFICNLQHNSIEEFHQHILTHALMLPYQCTRCTNERITIETLASLNKHYMMHQKPLKCRFCDTRFTTYGSRKLHEDLRHSENGTSFKCDTCLKEFTSKRSFQNHRKVHDDPASLSCKICLRTLSSAYEVKLHMRTHTGEKPNKCTFCVASFNRKSNLTEHVRRCHSLERSFICEICGERFRSNFGLKRHMVSHAVGRERMPRKVIRLPKELRCEECDRSFTTAIQYHSHKRRHVKRYQCSYCGIRIAQLRDFEDHQNTHTGTRPYECQTCGKKFKTASTYYGHRLVHSKDKKHFCGVCNKGFLRVRHVQVHMRTHTGEKPFRCETCGRSYADKQSYSRHKLTHRPTIGDMLRAKEHLEHSLAASQEPHCQEAFVVPIDEDSLQSEFVFSAVANADVRMTADSIVCNDQ